MELDQRSSKANGPNEITCNEERALAFDDHRLPTYGPSIKIELTGVDAQIPKDEGGLTQELEEQQGQELSAKETDPRQASPDEEMKPACDEQLEETERYEGVHSIPTPRDSPDWPVFEPDEPFQHHGAIMPSSPPAPTEISNLHLLLEVPDSPMRLFEASSPSRPLWEDDLPSVEPVADDHSQAIKTLFSSDTMNPAHLNQRPVRKALTSKPPGREHPLYKGTRGPDDKKETKEKSPMQEETEDYLKDRWETHRLVFETLMEKLNDPENPDNAAMTKEAQIHLSSLLKIQTKLDEKSKNDDEMGQEKTKEKGKEKTREESRGDDTE
ncbi:hypothetical protein NW754_002523 [Fusarium falciforme]|nr:hypothetical protein NW754_002523 [Fusarium falciforme]